MVCDSASQTVTIDGKPGPAGASDQLVGQVVTFSYDDQGKILDVATEGGGLDAKFAESLKQMLTGALAAAPPITLSVGESITVPGQVNIPIPTSAGTLSNAGETRYPDVGHSRRRRPYRASGPRVVPPSSRPTGSTGGAMDMRTASEGKMDVNVDRGIVLHTESHTTIDGSVHAGGQTAVPPMRTHGTMTMTADPTK